MTFIASLFVLFVVQENLMALSFKIYRPINVGLFFFNFTITISSCMVGTVV